MARVSAPPTSNGLLKVTTTETHTLEHWLWLEGAEPQDKHAHAEWQICEYLNAPGYYLHRGVFHGVPVGAFVVAPSGEVHRPEDPEVRLGARYRVWYFSEAAVRATSSDGASRASRGARIETVQRDPRLKGLLSRLSRQAAADDPDETQDQLLAALGGLTQENNDARVRKAISPDLLHQAWEMILDEAPAPVSLKLLAKAAGLSMSRFAHAFALRFHISPAALGLRLRTDHARTSILAGVSPALAASSAGFSDQAHLTRAFRRFVGPTPAAYGRLAGSFKTTAL